MPAPRGDGSTAPSPGATVAADPPLPFTGPWLLAPMEGVTDPAFRAVVLARHDPAVLGGAFTEFVRVVDVPTPSAVLRRHLGPWRSAAPVGVQLMGNAPAPLAETARRAAELGVPIIDLNFGCPAPGALRGCAGSALLRDPSEVARRVRAVVDAVDGATPVSAKIRAGYDDDRALEDLARAVEEGGASLLTVHCRTRAEAYEPHAADWSRVARAVRAVSIPVCGNGGVRDHADLDAIRDRTGCRYVMVGQAALADPWVFSGRAAGRAEAARFLVDYAAAMAAASDAPPGGQAKRVKQLLRVWTAGELCDEAQRRAWLRERDPEALLRALEAIAAPAAPLAPG